MMAAIDRNAHAADAEHYIHEFVKAMDRLSVLASVNEPTENDETAMVLTCVDAIRTFGLGVLHGS